MVAVIGNDVDVDGDIKKYERRRCRFDVGGLDVDVDVDESAIGRLFLDCVIRYKK